MPSILITRPQIASEFLAHELQNRGYAGVIEPLLSIVSTDMPQPDISGLQALMITSANALTALDRGGYDTESLLGIPCFCVGPRTAEKAKLFGFRKVLSSAGDGQALAQLIGSTLHNTTKTILHIAGRDTDSKAHDTLQAMGFQVTAWPIYEAVPIQQLSVHTALLLREKKIDGVTVFSVRTAQTLVSLFKKHGLESCCSHLVALALSPAVADTLTALPWKKLATAPLPTEDAVLDCLTEILPAA